MKNIFYLSLIALGLSFASPSQAQVRVQVNIGSQPLWGPVGYDYVRYYYMPELDVYYNVDTRRYTYFQGRKWVTKSKLPARYKNVNLFRTYKVVMNTPEPWRHHDRVYRDYRHFAHNRSQVVLRDRGRDHRFDHKVKVDKKHDKHRHDKRPKHRR